MEESNLFRQKKNSLDGLDGVQKDWADRRASRNWHVVRNFGGKFFMLLMGFSFHYRTKFGCLKGKQNSKNHNQTLEKHVLPFATGAHDNRCVLQQRNASARVSKCAL